MNSQTKEAGESRVFITAFQTPSDDLATTHTLWISQKTGMFKHKEIGCIVLEHKIILNEE